VWANAECTNRPVVGEVYNTLYVQFFRAFGYGDAANFENQLEIFTPIEGIPDPYIVALYYDWRSPEFDEPFEVGAVVECINMDPYPFRDEFKVSFDPLT
jgi:hypothetical protein